MLEKYRKLMDFREKELGLDIWSYVHFNLFRTETNKFAKKH